MRTSPSVHVFVAASAGGMRAGPGILSSQLDVRPPLPAHCRTREGVRPATHSQVKKFMFPPPVQLSRSCSPRRHSPGFH
eukprot:6142601-Prymnesium_polylepis.1